MIVSNILYIIYYLYYYLYILIESSHSSKELSITRKRKSNNHISHSHSHHTQNTHTNEVSMYHSQLNHSNEQFETTLESTNDVNTSQHIKKRHRLTVSEAYRTEAQKIVSLIHRYVCYIIND